MSSVGSELRKVEIDEMRGGRAGLRTGREIDEKGYALATRGCSMVSTRLLQISGRTK